MKRSNEFTHGGSIGKNLLLLFRSLLNVAAFSLLVWGVTVGSLPVSLVGAALSALCLWINLVQPLLVRKR